MYLAEVASPVQCSAVQCSAVQWPRWPLQNWGTAQQEKENKESGQKVKFIKRKIRLLGALQQ
jgi:hypothetical protein